MSTHPLIWKNGAPFSSRYQDIYFSTLDGAQESQRVFLEGNQLASRFTHAKQFTIVELGFGTGLNFLMTLQLWQQNRPRQGFLHFVSLEKHPLSAHELARCLMLWPALRTPATWLLARYSQLQNGINSLCCDQQQVCLSLVIGDAHQQLPQLSLIADAWFLDGFAPAKNPDMWSDQLFEAIAKRSHAGTSFATFTSASAVRRGLERVGFSVHKVSGYGKKREMLRGHFDTTTPYVAPQVDKAIVIGGGIAGASSARALANLGVQVTLLEAQASVASGASGHHQAVLYPRFRFNGQESATALEALNRSGFMHSWRWFSRYASYTPCGVIELGQGARRAWDEQDGLSAEHLSDIAGIAIERCGGYFADAGFLQPLSLCTSLLTHPNIEVCCNTPAHQLQAQTQGWQVITPNQCYQADVVVLATAHHVQNLLPDSQLPMQVVRGQTSLLASTTESLKLRCVVCDGHYITPALYGRHSLGATFERDDFGLDLREDDHQRNLAGLAKLSLALKRELHQQVQGGQVALRAQTPDYLPLCGQLLEHAALRKQAPRYDASPASLPWRAGLYVNVGHGAKGFLSAPLCASIIAAQITNTPMPAQLTLVNAMQANRFALRALGCKALAKKLLT